MIRSAVSMMVPAVLVLAFLATPARAHEKTSAGIELTTTVIVSRSGVAVFVEAQFGEKAAAPEAGRLDADGDGKVSDRERADYEETLGDRIRAAYALAIEDARTPLKQDALAVAFPLGPTGLPELSVRARFTAPWSEAAQEKATGEVRVRVSESLWPDAPGHRRVVVTGRPEGSVRYRLLKGPAKAPHRRPWGALIKYRRFAP